MASDKKGRPTRSRKDAEAERRRPLIPADRKLAKRIAKEKQREAMQRQQVALETGDERYLPLRDKGRARRFARDWVDARWSISEFVFPLMLIFIVGMLGLQFLPFDTDTMTIIISVFTFFVYGMFIISILEGIIVWNRIKKRIKSRYPNEAIPRGTWFYTYSRMLMARRWRSPKPQVARGDFPKVPAKQG